MELPDFLKGLEDIGTWTLFVWGTRWELNTGEVRDRATSKIDVQRNRLAVVGAGLVIACVVAPFVAPVAGIVIPRECRCRCFRCCWRADRRGSGLI